MCLCSPGYAGSNCGGCDFGFTPTGLGLCSAAVAFVIAPPVPPIVVDDTSIWPTTYPILWWWWIVFAVAFYLLLSLLVLLCWCCCCRRRRHDKDKVVTESPLKSSPSPQDQQPNGYDALLNDSVGDGTATTDASPTKVLRPTQVPPSPYDDDRGSGARLLSPERKVADTPLSIGGVDLLGSHMKASPTSSKGKRRPASAGAMGRPFVLRTPNSSAGRSRGE